jgi:hypothetical protein
LRLSADFVRSLDAGAHECDEADETDAAEA